MVRIITSLIMCTFIISTNGAVTWLSPINGFNRTVTEDTTIGTPILTLHATSTNLGAFLLAQDSVGDENADVVIFIEVEDVNDVEPVFTSARSVTLPTDTAVGSIIYVAQADDEDTVGSLVYSIKSGNEDQNFVMDATKGRVSLNKSFNITYREEFDLVIEVTDSVFTAEKAITFYLTDVIWRNPLDNQNISLPENITTDTDIVTLNADNAVVYTLSQDPGGNVFRIRNNKVLYVAEPIDYEQNRHYVLSLTAVASTGRSSEILYTVEVTDVNDEPLEFSTDTATVDISQVTEYGTVIFTAKTQDPDSVGAPTFSVTGGNSNNAFRIDSATGDLILVNVMNSSVTSLYTLTIAATDGVFTAILTLTVTVNAIVWVEPVKNTTDNVPENLATFVKSLTAETATVYVIQSVTPETDKFDIDDNQLVLTSALDYEDTKSYTLVLKAIDADGKSAAVTYIINVTDENDMAPKFQSAQFLVIPVNTEVGASIYLANATDQDTDSTIVYSITGGNRDNTFSINSSTGVLSLNKELSPSSEADLTYSLSIQADDSVHQVSLVLSIVIKPANTCTVQHKRLGDNVLLQYQALTVSLDGLELTVSNMITLRDGRTLLTVVYQSGKNVKLSECKGCTFMGDAATGNLTIRLDNLRASNAGAYIHVVDRTDNVWECIALFILGVPTKPIITPNKDPLVGENVTLTCNSTSTTKPSNHGLTLIYNWTVDDTDTPTDSRYSYSRNKQTLTLTNVVKEDANKNITCTATEDVVAGYTSPKSDAVLLNVLYPPSIVSFSVKGSEGKGHVTVNEHDDFQLICAVDSKPESVAKLIFKGKLLQEESETNTLSYSHNNAACLDAGVYTCEGKNGYGEPSYMTLTLNVKCSPRPLHQIKENFTSPTKLPVTLSFKVLAFPEPGPSEYKWYKHDGTRWTPLLSNADLLISSSGLQSNLTIVNVSKSDFGQYRLTIVNSLGTYEQYLFLKEIQDYTSRTFYVTTSGSINDVGDNGAQTKDITIIVGVVLGVLCFTSVVYGTIVTVLLKRETSKKETDARNKSVTKITYANLGFESNSSDGNGSASTDVRESGAVHTEGQYMSLDPFTKSDNAPYEAIQTL